MLSARSVIIIVVTLAVVSLLVSIVSLTGPNDRDGLAADTWGTRPYGYRGVFEIMGAVGVPVERLHGPPDQVLDREGTLVIWAPQDRFVVTEPVYLGRLGDWVRGGNRVVLGLREHDIGWFDRMQLEQLEFAQQTSAQRELGLRDLETEVIDITTAKAVTEGAVAEQAERPPGEELDEVDEALLRMREVFGQNEPEVQAVKVEGQGSLAAAAAQVRALTVPETLQVVKVGESKPSGTISIVAEGGQKFVIAAQYDRGQGKIVVVSDPTLLENRLIDESDNAVLAAALIGGAGGPVFWDGFYHGQTIRGNPMYLLTRASYAIIAAMIVLVVGIWLWRQGVYLGPPLGAPVASRRMVGEYLDAMARLFRRSAGSNQYMLEEVRRGVLWKLRQKYRVRGEIDDPRALAAAIARRDKQAARRLLDATMEADLALAAHANPSDRETLQLMKELVDCL